MAKLIKVYGSTLKIGKIHITPQRWPWQKSGKSLIWGRFGGGWNYKLGIDIGTTTIILNLLFGLIRFEWASADRKWAGNAETKEG